MKWRSHLSIGKAIADKIHISEGERRAFLDGIVEPDRHKERAGHGGGSRRLSHHRASERLIMLHVWMARRSFLRKDSYEGYRHLGMALHYIQDRSVSKGLLGMTHAAREERLTEQPVPMAAIEDGLKRYVASPDFIRRSVSLTRPKKDVSKIMLQASFRSAAVTAAVLDASKVSGAKKEHRLLRRKHSLIYLPMAIGSLAIGASVSWVWTSPFPILASLPFVALAIYLDQPYRRSARLAEWNGIGRH
ncbi:MAG: hypothetical protein NT131_00555 [Methanomassiliicoccales archaeon]|nr:hypothetical protein [Methanomassiliicoccales archaeon]